MNLNDLLFTGFNRRVAAVHRDSGEILWGWQAPEVTGLASLLSRGSGFVSLLPDGDRLFVSISGYLYALDALTGTPLWMNEMKGFGMGVASLATMSASTSPHLLAAATATAARSGAAAASSAG
ncbi:PQQ-binding-like beta-propeller repeat protein [Prosthecobacter sp.]|jgi:outer membrane protein assembly factor BamB|uniref:outer membrane protein assembly factor BamB family protein n=1 Tax=Prosthecobacter sp. TaxID=1965333 RepID=UPI0037CA7E30